MNNKPVVLVSEELMRSKIYFIIREGKEIPVVLDRDLADYYKVETKYLNQAANRNKSRFQGRCFKLSAKEYEDISAMREKDTNVAPNHPKFKGGGKIPFVYTEEGSLALSSVLKSAQSDKVFGMLLNSFFAIKQIIQQRPETLLHQEVYDLKNRILSLESKVNTPNIHIENFNNHGHAQVGYQNEMSIQISGFTDIIRLMTELLDHEKIKSSKEFSSEVKEAIVMATKEDKKGLLEKVQSISNITNTMADLAVKASPILLPIMTWLMS